MSKVLIIEDSSYMRRIIRGILNADGYEIVEADEGLKGLQMVKTAMPDCVLVDLIMPGIDGLKVLNVLHEEMSNVPVIVLTADIQESVREQCLKLGASGFINKPPKEEVLRDTVKKIIEARNRR